MTVSPQVWYFSVFITFIRMFHSSITEEIFLVFNFFLRSNSAQLLWECFTSFPAFCLKRVAAVKFRINIYLQKSLKFDLRCANNRIFCLIYISQSVLTFLESGFWYLIISFASPDTTDTAGLLNTFQLQNSKLQYSRVQLWSTVE